MKPRRSALALPRYTLPKPLKGGGRGYYFNVPTWARRKGCTISNEALGTDYDIAVRRVEKVLLPRSIVGALAARMPIPVWASWSERWTGCSKSTAERG